jgi:hypothetical protein
MASAGMDRDTGGATSPCRFCVPVVAPPTGSGVQGTGTGPGSSPGSRRWTGTALVSGVPGLAPTTRRGRRPGPPPATRSPGPPGVPVPADLHPAPASRSRRAVPVVAWGGPGRPGGDRGSTGTALVTTCAASSRPIGSWPGPSATSSRCAIPFPGLSRPRPGWLIRGFPRRSRSACSRYWCRSPGRDEKKTRSGRFRAAWTSD